MIKTLRSTSSLSLRRRWAGGLALLAWLLLPLAGRAQTAASYVFSQATGATYTPITGGTVLGSATNDDQTYTARPIGFTFSYAGSTFTTFSVNANGWIRLGGAITSSYVALSSQANALAALNRDLQGTAANASELRYQTIGTAPNQQLVVQWKGYRRYFTSTNTDNLNFQIILSQTTNTVQFAYGSNVIGGSATNTVGMPQVGINGAATTDFNDRTSTTSWTATTAGGSNTATVTLSTTVVPPSGLVFTYTPPSVCTSTPTAGTAAAAPTTNCGSTNNVISLTGGSTGVPGLSYQLQSSATSGGTYTNVGTASTSSSFTVTPTTTTYYRIVTTCTNSNQSATSTSAVVTVTVPPYATLPYTQDFESTWVSNCGTREAPDANWSANPITGDASWRRYDDGAAASWTSTTGSYTPAGSNAGGATSSFSARFHSYDASSGTTGALDLYANVSGGTGIPMLTFDYRNDTGTDKLEVFLSTDGGATFGTTALFTQVQAASWAAYTVPLTGATATTVIRFRATSDYGFTDIGLDNVNVSFVSCGAPTALAASAITTTSASIGFTAGSGNTGYTVTYTPTAGGAVTTVTPAPTASPVALSGLTPGTSYTVSIVGNCSASTTSTTATITFATPPTNDECTGAVVLTPATACAPVSGTVAGATESLAAITCAGFTSPASPVADVWYQFTATATQHTIAVVGNFDGVLDVRTGSCTTSTNFGCADAVSNDETLVLSTSVGTTYFLRYYPYFANPATPTFTICVTLPPACAPPTGVAAGAITSTSANATFTGGGNGNTSYTATATPTTGSPVTATGTASPLALTGLTPSTTYSLVIAGNCGAAGASAAVSFTTPPPPPANDDPTGAIALTTTATCVPTSGTNADATTTTANGYPNPGTCGVAINPKDVWYTFATAAGQTGATVTVTGSPAGLVRVFSAASSAGPFTQVSCSAGSTNNTVAPALVLSGLTPGTTYYISVSGYGSGDTQGSFTICVTLPPACSPPTGVAAGSITATSANATFSGGGNGNTSFTATATPTTGSPVTATGPALPIALTGLTPGMTYSLVITGNCGAAGASTAVSFTTPPLPPANDDCANAVVLTPGGTCTPVSGTVAGATQSLAAITCGSFISTATPVADVWYQFTATSTQNTISIVGGFDGVLDVRTGANCSASTNFGCSDAIGTTETLTLATTVGTTYFLRYYPYTASPTTPTFTICVTQPADLVVDGTNSPYTASGTYNNVTINNGGTANLSADLTVTGNLTINSGGTLNTAGNQVLGTGNFTLLAGGTLGIRGTGGISASPATTGVIRNTGATRSFSTDANYVYNGTAAQATGTGLPATVRSLTTTNANAVTLTAPVSVTQTVTVGGAGNLVLNGNALTLLSGSTGTALIVNSGTGIVSGSTGVAQRYIDGSLNSGAGYRHYSAPVSGSTVADLTTSGFSPEVSQASAYNTSATPGLVTPFPTVFGYDQSRLASVTSNYSAFDKGWVVPTATSTPLAVGQGYAVQIAASQLVDFAGTFTTGNQTLNLARNSGATAADAGWALVGNPYPAPLDWSLVADGTDRTGLDAAMYVFQSSGPYTGSYRSYANGVGGNPVVPMAQGFFVRVSNGQTSGSLAFRNGHRLTTPDATPLQRTTTDTRPLVQLDLRGAGFADAFYAYAQAGTTAGFDSQYDARKLPNSTGLNLASASPAGEPLAIDGRPAFTAGTSIPLTVGVPAAGTYSLGAATLANLPAGLDAYLTDAATGQTVPLSQGSYTFSLSTAQAASLITGRFTLHFSARVLTTATALTAADVSVYPNPAHESFTVLMPAVANATSVQAELLNALGQVVRKQWVALPTAGARFAMATADLATGIYTLRLQAGSTTLTKRVVIN